MRATDRSESLLQCRKRTAKTQRQSISRIGRIKNVVNVCSTFLRPFFAQLLHIFFVVPLCLCAVITHLTTGSTLTRYPLSALLLPGPRTSWGQIRDDRYPQWHCSGIQEAFGTCTGILMGDKWIQLGKWRLGCWHDDKHFAITHFEGKTAVVWTHEGKVLTGSGIHSKYNFWSLQPSPGFIKFGDMFMEFGQFRLGTSDSAHLVLEHSSGWQGSIWNYRGEVRDGPIRGNHLWRRPRTEPVGVGFGDRFLQIGNFRVGDVDGKHLSFATVGDDRTNEIIQWNGDHSPGPRNDFTTFGRSLMECKIQDMDAYSQHYLGGT